MQLSKAAMRYVPGFPLRMIRAVVPVGQIEDRMQSERVRSLRPGPLKRVKHKRKLQGRLRS
jgi:hypothetical protein